VRNIKWEHHSTGLWLSVAEMFVGLATSKRTNIGTTLRCAVGFNCDAILIVGDMNYGTHGAHGSQTRIKVIHFYNWREFQQFAKENNCVTYGIVDIDFSRPYSLLTSTEFPQDKQVIFLTGNKSGQLSEEQIEVCDGFVAVSFCGGLQFAQHVHRDVKLSICLHEYASSKNLEAGMFVGEKFVLAESKPQSERFESKSLPPPHELSVSPTRDISLGDFNLFGSSASQQDY
jgi:hypothetical protein